MIRINFGYLRMLYDAHLRNKNTVQQAVIDGHISPEQYERITGEAYTAPVESAPESPAADETDG